MTIWQPAPVASLYLSLSDRKLFKISDENTTHIKNRCNKYKNKARMKLTFWREESVEETLCLM